MLYPKNSSPLTDEDFKNPSSEYRATPFWAWNTKLDKDELIRQIEVFKELGYGGFHMHVRTGLATDYLSDEYMGMIGACVEKARQEKMLAWLYDEDRWPSGAAGGLVTKNKEYRIRHLLLTRRPYGSCGEVSGEGLARASSVRCENGELLACFDVVLDGEGSLLAYEKIGQNDSPRGIKLYAYAETALPNPWFNNQTYVDTLNPKAIKEFMRVTYDRYADYFQKDFGGLIPAIFTDEPQFSKKGTLHYAHEDRDLTLPWTGDFPQTYSKTYNGEDLIACLPELIWDLPGNKVSLVRYHYHDHIAERFAQAFADQCGKWCAHHGIMFTGHMMEEPRLESQTHALGEAMRSYRSFQLPGIDMLCDAREFTTAKQAQSAARQYGYPGVLSELYGVTNWDFDFRGHKLQGDWQAALGVSVRVPHLSWVSMNGEAKRDYPGTFNYQAPWYKEYPYVEDHFARLASVLTRGKAVSRIGVIHPIESYWLHWGPRESTEAVRAAMDERFQNLCDWLLRGFVDFDYICESTLPDLCDISKIRIKEDGNFKDSEIETQFPVGKMNYDVIIVPAMETIRASTLDRLEAFRGQGGKLIFLGPAPVFVDAVPNDRAATLYEQSEHIEFEKYLILKALEEYRDIRIRDGSGANTRDFLYQLREEGQARWLFVCHADRERNFDNPHYGDYRIQIRGEWQITEYNTIDGTNGSLDTEISAGWTCLKTRLWDHDSLLLKLVPVADHAATGSVATGSGEAQGSHTVDHAGNVALAEAVCFTRPVPVTLHEPNVLLLDLAEYALNDGTWRGTEEILRLDNILRKELGWPIRSDAVAQPWVEHDASTPHFLRLRYTFESEIPIKGVELAMENAASATVTLNGQAAGSVQGWYVDKCIGKVKLPDIKAGTNVLELKLPYGKKVDIESAYLLGDFSVKVQGTRCILGEPVKTLAFGDLTRQGLPFYGGNLTYHLEAETKTSGSLTVEASSYRFMLLKAAVDGADRGIIAYAPYQLTIDGLSAGKHKIDITGFGSRINTFGQLHNNERQVRMNSSHYWWGPNSWRSQGPAWTYEYRFWPQGIMKSPEIGIRE
ncbi:MAG: hypothetical protein LBI14_12075 [Treponema sp.]|nr:hypothetical protein [Treponema sp.]